MTGYKWQMGFVFFFVLLVGVSLSFGNWYYYNAHHNELDTQENELSQIVDWNTKQIRSLGVNSAIEMQNAELLIQILNVLEGNEVKTVPKEISMDSLTNIDESIEDGDVPCTFEQVNKDQREVDLGIRAAANNNLFQNQALHNILDKLISEKPTIEETSEETTFPLTFPLLYSPEESKDFL